MILIEVGKQKVEHVCPTSGGGWLLGGAGLFVTHQGGEPSPIAAAPEGDKVKVQILSAADDSYFVLWSNGVFDEYREEGGKFVLKDRITLQSQVCSGWTEVNALRLGAKRLIVANSKDQGLFYQITTGKMGGEWQKSMNCFGGLIVAPNDIITHSDGFRRQRLTEENVESVMANPMPHTETLPGEIPVPPFANPNMMLEVTNFAISPTSKVITVIFNSKEKDRDGKEKNVERFCSLRLDGTGEVSYPVPENVVRYIHSADGTRLLVLRQDAKVNVYDTRDGLLINEFDWNADTPASTSSEHADHHCIDISPDGTTSAFLFFGKSKKTKLFAFDLE